MICTADVNDINSSTDNFATIMMLPVAFQILLVLGAKSWKTLYNKFWDDPHKIFQLQSVRQLFKQSCPGAEASVKVLRKRKVARNRERKPTVFLSASQPPLS